MGCDISDECYKLLEIDVLESGQYKISFEYTRLCFQNRDHLQMFTYKNSFIVCQFGFLHEGKRQEA
jgi:hypothetical protein